MFFNFGTLLFGKIQSRWSIFHTQIWKFFFKLFLIFFTRIQVELICQIIPSMFFKILGLYYSLFDFFLPLQIREFKFIFWINIYLIFSENLINPCMLVLGFGSFHFFGFVNLSNGSFTVILNLSFVLVSIILFIRFKVIFHIVCKFRIMSQEKF